MVAAVERVEHQRVGRARRPQAQRVHELPAPADHRRVVGDRDDAFRRVPDRTAGAVGAGHFNRTAEADHVAEIGTSEFPGVAEGQPVLRELLLPTVADHLAKQAMVVADAVAVCRDAESCEAVHVAGGQPAQAAIAQGSVGLQLAQAVEIDVELAQGGAHRFHQAEIVEGVVQQPADEEFQRQVVDTLAALEVGGAGGGHPAFHHAVAHRQRGGDEPVAFGGNDGVAADRVGQLGDDAAAQGRDVLVLGGERDAGGNAARVAGVGSVLAHTALLSANLCGVGRLSGHL